MKRFLLIAMGAALVGGSVSAQDLASTSPKNKNVVLEDFTGRKCTFCPDGTRLAEIFAKDNPGRVLIIGAHCGSYATGTPDYNVMVDGANYGNALYQEPGVDLKGFPAGTINRRLFAGTSQGTGTAQSRGSWATTGADVLAEASPVNVGIKGTYDPVKFKLYIEVEAYYTDDEVNITNKMNVGILQNGIWGPQTGASRNPDAVDLTKPNGNTYRHDHMLRAVLTGQWGEEIANTTKGSLFAKVYEYDVPEKIGDADVDPTQLEVYAFVAEGKGGVLSAEYVAVVEGTDPRIVDVTSISDLNSSITEVNVFPNPTSGNATLKVNSENSFNATIKVVAVTGAVVSNSLTNVEAGSNEIVIEMNSLEEGIYFVEVANQEGIVARQSVVKK